MPSLEFCLPPAELPRLLRNPAFGRRSGRSVATDLVWYDTAAGALAADRLSLCQTQALWRLERTTPRRGEIWPPGTPAPLVAEAADPSGFGPLPDPLMPIAGFHGERRVIRLDAGEPASLSVLHGVLRGVAQEQPVCRLVLEGPEALLLALSTAWAALPIEAPQHSLAVEAIALARGIAAPPRRTGGPEVVPGTNVADAIVMIIGHLTDVILAEVPAAASGQSEEPVHAMRVAVRRLRSALSLFRRVADGPAMAALKPRLADLARTLGHARDWDVFLAGIAADIAVAMPDDRRIKALLAAAHQQRQTAYASLRTEFASAGFRHLGMSLIQFTALRPWHSDADEERQALLDADAGQFAAGALTRQYRRLMEPGAAISELPTEELHTIRKEGKKLRYMSEFFIQFYGDRRTGRFLRRLSQLQETLGHLNDGAATAMLMQAVGGGPDRQFAVGAVQGFTIARTVASRKAAGRHWNKLRLAKPFWF